MMSLSERPGSTVGRPRVEPHAPVTAPALPPEQRLDMPRQAVDGTRAPRVGGWRNTLSVFLARILVAAGSVALTAFGVHEMYRVLATDGVTSLQWLFLALFAVNFTWISFAGCQAVVGFIALLAPAPRRLRRPVGGALPGIRTAVLFPVYCERPGRVAASIGAIARGLAAVAPDRFAVFVLSDTNRPDAWVEEEVVYSGLVRESDPRCPVYYRHRRRNTERKAGNIADWVMRWGGGYEAMAVLDADSVMAPETLVEMARRIESDPGLGLLQTAPAVWRAESLYGRMQQFANRCYGPVVTRGLAAWHGRDGNFWGHNAIIRTCAFAAAARLPELRGRPPFGGHVLSHDFIEAALLRRAGYGIRLDADLAGSFEEAPPALQDVIVRDRRWCQGNLQHARFLLAQGLVLPSRLHLLSGIMAYLSSPLWLMLVVVGLVLAAQALVGQPGYFAGPSLFPVWPVFDSERAVELFLFSTAILLAPKAMGVVVVLLDARQRRTFGGSFRLIGGALAETVLSALYAPVMMIAQSRLVAEVLSGRDSGWKPQRRDDGRVPFAAALKAHRLQIAAGAGLGALAFQLNPDLLLWLAPVSGGLISAGVLEWASGSARLGSALRRAGLLLTPEEGPARPAILTEVERHAGFRENFPAAPALQRLADDAALRQWHLAQLPGGAVDPAFDAEALVARAKAELAGDLTALQHWLTPSEAIALLHDTERVAGLQTARRAA